ncbi:MAG: putative peptidoglycan glycosyltransferase FtsW [bacterium]|nr:putative peptidoglycan glycosyltransferase FtsW [bacterium]
MKFLGDSVGRPIAIIAIALSAFGLIAVLSASASTGASDPACGFNSLYFFIRQFISFGLGIGLLLTARHWINLDKARKWLSLPAFLICLALAVAVLFFPSQNGAKRWIHLGFFNVQVGEICKVIFVCFWADLLARRRTRIGETDDVNREGLPQWKRWLQELREDVRPFLGPLLLSFFMLGIIEMGRDLGTLILIALTIVSMLFVAGLSMRLLFRAFVVMTVVLLPLLFFVSYRFERMKAWVAPMDYASTTAYQAVNSFMAIASGKVWGCGMPFSGQKYGFLPEQHTDFIYAVICEEIGFVGSMGILTLFALLCYCGFRLASRCKDPYRALLAFGISSQMALQVLINVSVVTGLAPNKGLPLPLISYGGSSMCITLFSIGLLLNIADTYRRSGAVKKKTVYKRHSVRRGHTLSNSLLPYPSESSDVRTSPISSGEWRKIVGSDPENQKRHLPGPRVKEGWKVIDINESSRQRRERLKKVQDIV